MSARVGAPGLETPGLETLSGGNRLSGEKSPYLLQHAHNPVDWYPWSEEAFARARREEKPIFLSIGYATCHWCHVMERESFENGEIAALLNDHFVNIKVDREERPDVDRVYMTFVQATRGHGGWPMSVWLTPELKPFFGGTYFPPERRHGQPGFGEVIQQITAAWQQERDQVRGSAEEIVKQLGKLVAVRANESELLEPSQSAYGAFKAFQRSFDPRWGGFGGAPKFPRPSVYNQLLRYYARTGDDEAARMTLQTLREMARGGMYDQLGGGFHRYSVDAVWHVPHFEKMLYDQAQLARSYVEAYQLTGDPAFARVARGIFEYVARDLTDADGAFYSAEDADSAPQGGPEGLKREGAFYVWTHDELESALGERAALFAAHYGVRPEGNAEDPHGELVGQNVLHELRPLEDTARELGLAPAAAATQLEEAKARLLALRGERPRPLLDDKILCGWNGMMISALARGASAFDDPELLRRAGRAAGFVERVLYDPQEERLYRRYRAGERAIDAQLDDYVQLVEGLLDLYEASFELQWLRWAERLTERQNELFYDDEHGGYFASSGRDPSVLLRLKDDHDGAEPAGNSLGVCNLLRLAALLDRDDFARLAAQTLRLFAPRLLSVPQALPQLVVGAEMERHPPAQIVIVGERDEPGVSALQRVCFAGYAPNKVVLLADGAFKEAYGERLAHIVEMKRIADRPTAYLCRERSCQQPTSDPEELKRQLVPVAAVGL